MIKERIKRINNLIKNENISDIIVQYSGRYDFFKCYKNTNELILTIIIETASDFSGSLFDGFEYPIAFETGNDLISPVYGSELLKYKNEFGYCDIETITIRINTKDHDPFYIDAINVDYMLEHDKS